MKEKSFYVYFYHLAGQGWKSTERLKGGRAVSHLHKKAVCLGEGS